MIGSEERSAGQLDDGAAAVRGGGGGRARGVLWGPHVAEGVPVLPVEGRSIPRRHGEEILGNFGDFFSLVFGATGECLVAKELPSLI